MNTATYSHSILGRAFALLVLYCNERFVTIIAVLCIVYYITRNHAMCPINFFCGLRKKTLFELATMLDMSYTTLRRKADLGTLCEEEIQAVAEYLDVERFWFTLSPEAFADYLHEALHVSKSTAV